MTEVAPPSYDGFGFEALVRSSHGASDLPAYTRRTEPPATQSEPREFKYHIKSRNGGPWATMTVQGDPRLTKLIPTILEGSNLVGTVTLALQNPETIQAVCISIKGEIIGGQLRSIPVTFMDTRHTLWSAAEGDPLAPEAGPSKSSSIKLKGDYSWPFSLPVPTTVTKDGTTYHLPHTYLDRLALFSLRYLAELRIVRGKLRPDDKTTCTFGYFSMRQPGPPSALRMLAYQENSPLLGPEADPEGWHTQCASIKGLVFSSRMIEVKFKLSLAAPLSYTRSASIPCAMTIECDDKQALDLLAAPASSIVVLERLIRDHIEGYRNVVEACGQASFWPSTEGDTADLPSNQRYLMGEIHLKGNLQPSSAMLDFLVEYNVVCFPFQAAGFKAPDPHKPILQQVVEITTRYPAGPRPKTYSPPAYEHRNVVVDQYYYQLVIQNTNAAGMRSRGAARGRGG